MPAEIGHLYRKNDMLEEACEKYKAIHRCLAGTVSAAQFISGYMIPLLKDLGREDEIESWRAKLPEWAR